MYGAYGVGTYDGTGDTPQPASIRMEAGAPGQSETDYVDSVALAPQADVAGAWHESYAIR
jgi:hypothetical protein